MAIFYHITFKSRKKSIKQRGLTPPVWLTNKAGLDAWTNSFLLDAYETGRLDNDSLLLVQVNVPKDWISETRSKSSTKVAKEFVVNLPIPPSKIKDFFSLDVDLDAFLDGKLVIGKRGGKRKIRRSKKQKPDFARI